MARNGSGTYTKAVSSFSPGGTITASDHNSLWDDLVTEITNSVATDGQTTMTGPLKASNGTAAAPALTFGSDADIGFYRVGANSIGLSLEGSAHLTFATSSATWTQEWNVGGAFNVTGTANFSATAAFNNGILVSGTSTFTHGFIASATSTFVAPILCSGTATFTKGFIASATCSFDTILCSTTATFSKGFIAAASASFSSGSLAAPNTAKAFGHATYSGGTPTLQANSFNIASITDEGTGDISFNFTNAMENANYAVSAAAYDPTNPRYTTIRGRSVSAVRVAVFNAAGSGADPDSISIIVFAN